MPEQEFSTDYTFPRPLEQSELAELAQYLAFHLPGNTEVQLQIEGVISAGTRFEPKPHELEALAHEKDLRKVTGTISRETLQSANFTLERGFRGEEQKSVFTGIQFHVCPGYKPGQLSSDDLPTMQETQTTLAKYFSEHN